MANPLGENLQFLPQQACKQPDLNTPPAVTMLERSHGSDDGVLDLGLANQAAGDEEDVLSMLCLMDLVQDQSWIPKMPRAGWNWNPYY